MAQSKKTTYVNMQELMDLAIRFEDESAAFYAQMRNCTEEKSVRDLLKTLQEQEEEHARLLRESEMPKDRDIILQFAPELSLSMPMPGDNPGFDQMLSVAIERERVSVRIYRRASERTLGEFKEMLEGLALFEEEHERKLKALQRESS
jgi:rubrerythrin